ncbi:MAG: hypothetical protein M1299_07945 [Firmicutes bacterium]|nr:hypothetical protein [Bacillota bacterium]MCL5039733.1 hypothetical protein [Bacillota bacterium]
MPSGLFYLTRENLSLALIILFLVLLLARASPWLSGRVKKQTAEKWETLCRQILTSSPGISDSELYRQILKVWYPSASRLHPLAFFESQPDPYVLARQVGLTPEAVQSLRRKIVQEIGVE